VWLVFPPTDHNLGLWAKHIGLHERLFRYGGQLEGGIIIRTSQNEQDDGNCINMPAGSLHSVFTTHGGFLYGINYSTANDLLLASKMIRMQLGRNQEVEQILQDIDWYHSTLEKTLKQAYEDVIPLTFYGLNLLLHTCDAFPHRRNEKPWKKIYNCEKQAHKVWKNQAKGDTQGFKCTCGAFFTDFRRHYMNSGEGHCEKLGPLKEDSTSPLVLTVDDA
jgi:hypothetical protein